MPGKKVSKRLSKKQGRRSGKGTILPLSLNPQPLRSKIRVCLPYQAGKNLTEAALGSGATQTWSLTGCYDPDITGVGVQPIGFDPWTTMYQNFLVMKVTFEVTYSNTTANMAKVGFLMNNLNSLPASLAAWPSDPNGKFVVLGPSSGNRGVTTLRMTILPWKVLQVPYQSYYSDTDYIGSPTQNPVRQLYLIIWATGFSVLANVDTVFRVTYEVEFRNPWLQNVS